ncbi:MAG: LLM class flavin-dependent oxidoreductase [Candidatus Rokuibacteriota bacterium]
MTPTGLRFGVFLPAYVVPGEAAPSAAFLQDYARRAEDVGFDGVWVFDHLFDAPPSYRVVFLEPVTTLACVIPATRRVTVGTGILVLPVRDPVVTAKAFANLDVLSEGRLVFGAGVGWEDREFRACQVPKAMRGRRMDEMLEPGDAVALHKLPVGDLGPELGDLRLGHPRRVAPAGHAPFGGQFRHHTPRCWRRTSPEQSWARPAKVTAPFCNI